MSNSFIFIDKAIHFSVRKHNSGPCKTSKHLATLDMLRQFISGVMQFGDDPEDTYYVNNNCNSIN